MTQAANIEVPFEQLLAAVDRLDIKERDLLHDRLIKRAENTVVRQAEEAAQTFNLPGLTAPLSYWSVEKVLNELHRRLKDYEQTFEADSKTFYLAARKDSAIIRSEQADWPRLYETYQRLRVAKRRVDLKAGRLVEPLPFGKIVSNQLTLVEVEAKLSQFEKRYDLSSAEFYERFKQGQQGDDVETFDWLHTYCAYLTMTGQDT